MLTLSSYSGLKMTKKRKQRQLIDHGLVTDELVQGEALLVSHIILLKPCMTADQVLDRRPVLVGWGASLYMQ